jgi:hypothetical protein
MKKVCMFLILCLVAMGVYGHNDVNNITQIDIMAKGLDEDIGGYLNPNPLHSAETLIVGKIQFDEVSGLPISGDVEFHMTINDVVTGEKVYSIKGHLKNGMVMVIPFYPCPVRNVMWTNLWYVFGAGKVKTTEPISIEYRGNFITLPNTEGKYITMPIAMVVSPEGDYVGGVWPEGGWAFAGFPGYFGGITLLTKYLEN